MDKAKACERLTFCGECGFWYPQDRRGMMLKEEFRGYIGVCHRPYESPVNRNKDDFCSRGVKKIKEE